MSVFHNNALIGSGAGTGAAAAAEYVIPKSLRFNSGDSSDLRRTPSAAGDTRTFTLSAWLKRGTLGSYQRFFGTFDGSNQEYLRFENNDTLRLFETFATLKTDQVFRDCSSFYHIVVSVDSTQATASNRIKLYVNGSQVTSFSTETYPSQNATCRFNTTVTHHVGSAAVEYFNGLIADIQFIDGQQLAPTDFGETRSSDGVWVPKEASFTSPNDGTTWSSSTSGGAVAGSYPMSQSFDGSTSTAGVRAVSGGGFVFGGSLGISYSSSVRVHSGASGIGTQQFKLNDGTATDMAENTFVTVATGTGTLNKLEITAGSTGNANIYLGAVEVDGVILQDGLGRYGKNGFHLNFSDSSTNEALGYDSAPTVPDLDPKKGMDVITYTGTGSTQNIGGLQFEPGLVWTKSRSLSELHILSDSVRGVPKNLYAHLTNAEDTAGYVTALNYDGFTVTGSAPAVNQNNATYVAWVWRAGGPAVSNTNGSINAEVSANTDYGFSIAKYTVGNNTSQTIGHGLTNQTPKFIIVKETNQSNNWQVYHASLGNTKYLYLNSDAAAATNNLWNNTSPTTSVFTIRSGGSANFYDGKTQIAYCWSEVSGYSKFGSYTGNGSSTGPVITTGFKPRFLLVKNTNSSRNWVLWDTERANNDTLKANSSGAEESNYQVDALSNGFQIKNTWNEFNENGATIVYAAFADRPGNNWDVNNIVTNEGLTTSKTQFDVVTYTGNGGTQSIGGPSYSSTGDQSITSIGQIFNGSTSNGGYFPGTGTNKTLTTTPFTINTQLRIRNNFRSDGTYAICLNGSCINVPGSGTDSTAFRWSTVDLSSFTLPLNVTSLGYSLSQNSGNTIMAIEVDSTILVDGTGPGLKFQPDLVWIKERSGTDSGNANHVLVDSVRGSTKTLYPNTTSTETTGTVAFKSFNPDGFTLGLDTTKQRSNDNNDNYVAWCWKAGGTAVSNTDGSITSSVSANAAYGFSIVSWTGTGANATVGHGLNNPPGMILVKTRDSAYNWFVYHKGVASDAETDYLRLNTTGAAVDSSAAWNDTAPTSSVFSVGTDGSANESGDDMVAYCFANVPGYQRIGSYVGTGASGKEVVLGFKPRFLMIKSKTNATGWWMWDTERGNSKFLLADNSAGGNANDALIGNYPINATANGFTIDNTADLNQSGVDYIYLAIGDDEIGSDEDCLVDVPNAVTADADATDTTGGYQRGNYCTWNPLLATSGITLSNGNLKTVGSANYRTSVGTIGMSSGKFYWEVALTHGNPTSPDLHVGIGTEDFGTYTGTWAGSTSEGWVYTMQSGDKYHNNTGASYGAAGAAGDVIGVAFDADGGNLYFYKNGTAQNSGTAAYTGLTSGPYFPIVTTGNGNGADVNWGQMRFKYPMPSGYAALNTTALPAATIADGSAQFETKLYTANATARSLTGYKFAPDWLWFKPRVAGSHNLYDAVRGATKGLRSQGTDSEYTDAQTLTSFNSDGFSLGTDSGGYQVNYSNNSMVVWAWNAGANSNKTYTVKVVSDSGNKYRFDDFGTSAVTLDLAEGSTYIFDQSDSSNAGHPIRFGTSANGTDYTTGVTHTGTPGSAGAKTTLVLGTGVSTLYYSCLNHSGMGGQINTNSTAGASNFDGSLQSTAKANPEAGFSIVSYNSGSSTGNYSVGHGLNAAPKFIIHKTKSSGNWWVYHESVVDNMAKYLQLNSTNALATNSAAMWGAAAPASSVFGVRVGDLISTSQDAIAYCFAPVAGYSAFGSYTGNASADGPFVYTGFRPAFVIIKCSSTSNSYTNWDINDSARDTFNVADATLAANISDSENSGNIGTQKIDFLSNGFKIRQATSSSKNLSGATYVWAAWAENPFQANGGLAR